jgi:hypothetical protein
VEVAEGASACARVSFATTLNHPKRGSEQDDLGARQPTHEAFS